MKKTAGWFAGRLALAAIVVGLGGDLRVRAEAPVPAYQFLRAGEVKPQGWLKAQMLADLHEGLAGHYPDISRNVDRHLFEKKDRQPEVMAQSDRRPEKSWWAGEHEGYWKDGVIRMAFLTDDETFMAKAREWIEGIVAAQDADGYIGIYDKATRFPMVQSSDGELWAQSRIFQAMLAYYEFTGDAKVLAAVEKAVNLTLSKHNDTYFCRPGKANSGGVSHGLAFCDTLEQLYRLTGKPLYRERAVWLYNDYCKGYPADDTALPKLLDARAPFDMHAPHVLEGIAVSQIVGAYTGEGKYLQAARNARAKLARHTPPGGGLVGDESVLGRPGTGATYSEYCSYTEGVIGLNRILAYTGDLTAGEWVEQTCLNGAQGARTHTANRAVAYLSRDDRRSTDIKENVRGRIYYSACHLAAACCTLNAIRLLPYYVEGMWFRPSGAPALAANLYGPCRVSTQLAGTQVGIKESTAYPFEDTIHFKIDPAQPVEFALVFRVPEAARDATLEASAGAKVTRAPGRIEVRKLWKAGDTVALRFDFDVRLRETNDKQFYYQRGPLVFALKFPEKMTETLKFELKGKDSGFREYQTTPLNDTGWDYRVDKAATFTLAQQADGDPRYPWAKTPVALQGKMRTADGQSVDVKLVPEGSTILRRVTFPAN
jgi:hypothetical protein